MWHYYGGSTEFVSLDNLKAGVLKPDLWESAVQPCSGRGGRALRRVPRSVPGRAQHRQGQRSNDSSAPSASSSLAPLDTGPTGRHRRSRPAPPHLAGKRVSPLAAPRPEGRHPAGNLARQVPSHRATRSDRRLGRGVPPPGHPQGLPRLHRHPRRRLVRTAFHPDRGTPISRPRRNRGCTTRCCAASGSRTPRPPYPRSRAPTRTRNERGPSVVFDDRAHHVAVPATPAWIKEDNA